MAGILSSFVLAGLLAAGPVDFTFDGPQATARTVGNAGFFTQGPVPFTDLFERGTGSAELFVQDRITDPGATYGDVGRLVATFTLAGDSYRVELDQAGFPPAQALTAAGTPVSGPWPSAPAQPIAGGVVLNQELHGGAALGFSMMTREHAAAAVWGVGRVWRNGALLTDTAIIHAAALDQGAHADDGTFRVLAVARPGDTELDVLVWNLPPEAEPRGFIQFDFDDVAITVGGADVPALAFIPTAGVYVGVAPPSSPVPGGASLGAVPNTTPQGVGGAGLVTTAQAAAQAAAAQAGTAQTVTQPVILPPATDGLSDAARTTQLAPNADVTLPGPASQVGGVVEPFLAPGRVSPSTQTPSEPDVVTPGFQPTPIVPQTFVTPNTPGRVALNQSEPGPPGQPDAQLPVVQPTPFVPSPFQNPARQQTSSQLAPATVGGFVPLTPAPQSTFVSTQGSFSVVPLVPGVAGPEFAFGGSRVTAGVVRTPSPAQVQTPAVPLVSSPVPLNAEQPVPLVATPLPINGQPAVPLITTPPPLNSQPVAATPPGATTPATTSTAPGLVTSNPNAGIPGTTAASPVVAPGTGTATPGVATPGAATGGAAPSP